MGMSKDVTVQEDTNDNSMRPSNMTDNDQSTSFMMQVSIVDVDHHCHRPETASLALSSFLIFTTSLCLF